MKLLSTSEAAKLIINAKTKNQGISRGRVIHMIHSGLLPAQKLGRDWFIDPVEIKKLDGRSDGRPRR